MKKLLLISATLITASSVVNASENSGNMRTNIIAQAAQEAPVVQKQMEALQDSVDLRKWLQDSVLFDAVPAEPVMEQAAPVAVKSSVRFLGWLQSQKEKASEYVRPHVAHAQSWINGLALSDKVAGAKSYVQSKYAAAINSDFAKKVSDYGNQGIELVKENPKTATAVVAGTTAIAITAWLVKKLYFAPESKRASVSQKKNDIKVSVPNAQMSYIVTTEIVAEIVEPVVSLYPTEDMQSYEEFVNERDRLEGNIPSVYPRIN